MAFAVQGFIDRVLRRQGNLNPVAILHFQKGLRLLRERLLGDDDQTKISDSTMSVVLKLASVAQFDGDYETSKQHMEGLRKMVDLRGGLDVFEGTPLLLEMLRQGNARTRTRWYQTLTLYRCDLGVALLNGSCPVFFIQPSEPMAEYPEKLMPASVDGALSRGDMKQVGITEDELVTAWRVLKRFCLFIDLGTQTRQTVRSDIIYETMTAVTYRLLHMRFSSGSADEAVRQGLSAFCYHVFLQWQDIKPPYCDLAVAYQISIFSLVPSDAVSSQLILWLLIIGAISIFNISDEVWLRERIEEHVGRCHIKTWREMQDILKSFMWIAVLDEQSGRRIYDFLFK